MGMAGAIDARNSRGTRENEEGQSRQLYNWNVVFLTSYIVSCPSHTHMYIDSTSSYQGVSGRAIQILRSLKFTQSNEMQTQNLRKISHSIFIFFNY